MAYISSLLTHGHWSVLRVAGTVDDRRVPALRAQLDEAVDTRPRVAVDLTGCRLTGTRWMSVLLGAAHRAHERGHLFAVVSPRPHAARLCLPVLARGGRLLLCESAEHLPKLKPAERR
ncbi:STAS domain-containing protein [[Actinomadura] parvosata]|uniref:STAS domain-containing protein n=1 Tax=[Actinomadura] parvosata TaxID=1955412 RepID=UPI00406CBFBC